MSTRFLQFATAICAGLMVCTTPSYETKLLAVDSETLASIEWPTWRGRFGNGLADGGSFPTKWSETSNILWKKEISGRGASTPVVIGDKIFLTSGIDGKNTVLAFNLAGEQLWKTECGNEQQGKHQKATGANPSPVTDGERIYCYFKSDDLVCLDLEGKILWKLNVGSNHNSQTLWWDLGTSPVLAGDSIIVAMMQSGPSFLVSYDKMTGKENWRADRQMNVNSESNQACTTPVLAKYENGWMILTLGADHITAHDTQTGEELWRLGGFNPTNHQYFRTIASPVVSDDGSIVLCPYARGETLTAVRTAVGLKPEERILWHRSDLGVDVPTPALSGDRIIIGGDKGDVSCLDLQTGKTLWSGSLPRNRNAYSSSPIIAGGNIYLVREDATTFVVRNGEPFEIVSENQLDGNTVTTPVFVDGKVLIRTYDALYCIGE